jgi:hypothetical protein
VEGREEEGGDACYVAECECILRPVFIRMQEEPDCPATHNHCEGSGRIEGDAIRRSEEGVAPDPISKRLK